MENSQEEVKHPQLIAYFGANGAGKDYLAAKKAAELRSIGYTVGFLPFAKKVKEVCAELAGESESFYHGPIIKKQNVADSSYPRRALMEDVTDLGYKISPTHWFDLWEEGFLLGTELGFDYIIVTDYRYIQSLDYIRKYNGELIYVKNWQAEISSDPEDLQKLYYLEENSKPYQTITNTY